jgi:hypothetical protein
VITKAKGAKTISKGVERYPWGNGQKLNSRGFQNVCIVRGL